VRSGNDHIYPSEPFEGSARGNNEADDMTDLEKMQEAVNRTRVEFREREQSGNPDINVHDLLALFAAKLDEVRREGDVR
jgi:hypothetical protein